ncbi:ArsR/SmtB family transcription factor [Staphylococcus lutrae]|uniref:Transcriptional regulator n=1 Tax=Staphylococcus lutrae TaxID=155085 RepID=A0AAC9WKE7_9STAP|nr:metalloregulator ArsR/SmtB family transcription factor [Staphylococcus lutrae]ARJ51736.1 transcriptional regulator [Staphylococcus lutrae]PNZ34206.1 transcriptional regulator [Staphylococcus lutrae]
MVNQKIPTCETYRIDVDAVHQAKKEISDSNIERVSQMFKSIADVNRSKIVFALCQHEELCVCDIADILGVTVANASHHLRSLYKNGIVVYRKSGKRALYRLYDEHIRQLMMISIEHKKEVDEDESKSDNL